MGLTLVVVLATAGLAWQECLLLVAASMAALRLERRQLADAPPSDAWRVGARALVAGAAGLLGTAIMGMLLLSATALGWLPSHDQPTRTLVMIVGAGITITAMRSRVWGAVKEAALWLIASILASASLLYGASAAGAWVCITAGLGIGFVAWSSWRLACVGSAFFRFD